MLNKKVKLLLCWLLVCAAVWIFSDREAQTYVFEGENLQTFVESLEDAETAEKEALDRMYLVQADANRRTNSGIWGDEENNARDVVVSRRAMDENGLNLMWGDYDITLTLAEPEKFEGEVVCAGKSRLIENGKISTDGQTEVHGRFTVKESVESIRFATNAPDQVVSVTVSKCGTTIIDPDLVAFMILAGIALTVLIILSEENRSDSRERRGAALILLLLIVFISGPMMWRGVYDGHDLQFHANRIEGIASALRMGQIPVRIHASTLQGYGYAASIFYPEFFLYFPALLRNLGITLSGALRIFVVVINAATVLCCYISIRKISRRRDLSLAVTMLYVTSSYRIANLYTRATYGESLAMIFFPLLIWAMWEVLEGDESRWPLLALAMTCICASHLLSVLFCTVFCALAALLCLPKLFREKRRIVSILLAAGVTAVCFVGFLIPMLDYIRDGINTNVSLNPEKHALRMGGYMIAFPGLKGWVVENSDDYAYSVGVIPGMAIMLGIALFGIRRYQEGNLARNAETEKMDRFCTKLLLLGGLAMFMATDVFPWKFIRTHRPFTTVVGQMQFPWRLMSVAVPLLSVTAAWGALREEKLKKTAMTVLVTVSVLTASYTMQSQVERLPLLYQDSYMTSFVGQYEYIYFFTQSEALWPGDLRVKGTDPYEITAYEKNGNDLTFTVKTTPGEHSIELPLLYYPGYAAEGEGCGSITMARGNNNVILLNVEDMSGEASFHVWFKTPVKWTVATLISTCGGILLLLLSVLDMRRHREAKPELD